MGGNNSSPRRITIEQEENSGVLKVSEAVARRLVGKPDLPERSSRAQKNANQALTAEQRDGELLKLQSFYEKRIDSLEKKNTELYQTTTEQFAKAVEEVESKFLKTTLSPVCQDLQEAVLKCYQANPKYTLNCSPQVQAFNECVQKQRERILSRKG